MKKQNKKQSNKKIKLSIIILSYNTQDLLKDCLESLKGVKDEINFEVIVVDNASSDNSVSIVKEQFPEVHLIENDDNLGFAAGNNLARDKVQGEYVLFLNSDTIIKKGTFNKLIDYMDSHPDVGAVSSKLVLQNGDLDKDVRRSFPTPWVAFTHLVIPLDRLFPNSSLFAKYWYLYKDEDEVHEVDVLQGAFFLTRKGILDLVGWFSEEYFLDGEDIDLSWKIKDQGYKLIYYPKVETIHLKGASKGKDQHKQNVPKEEKLKYRLAGVNSMKIFYKKRLWKEYPFFVNYLVLFGLTFLKYFRSAKAHLLG